MDRTEIVEAIDAEIKRLQEAKTLLEGTTVTPRSNGSSKRTVSAESRARMAAAQKARWAKVKK
jgi:hypothetical protein